METWQPCTVTLRGLVDENHPILLLIYRAMKNGRQGRTRTYGVSSVAALQAAAFATQRHLTKKTFCVQLGGQDSNLQVGLLLTD